MATKTTPSGYSVPAARRIPGQAEAARAAKTAEAAALALKEGELVVSETQRQDGRFKEEQPDVWEGYVEWEKYPDKKAIAHELMKATKFPPPPEFQLAPVPKRNPTLYGDLYKDFHHAVGMDTVPEYSWGRVLKEKAKTMNHVLAFPYNGEPNHLELLKDPVTPNDHHFVRNHGGIPKCINPDKYEVEIGGKINKKVSLKLSDLKDPNQFPQHKLAVTLQCCGTRRIEQIALYPGHGLLVPNAPWPEAAIGNAVYTGVYLKDVLERACGGITVDRMKAHAEFISADTYFKFDQLYNYAVSVPYRFVDKENVMLAFEMNGEPLPEIHGYPLRIVVPGVIGARSAKWVTRINILDEPSWGPVQRMEYLYYSNTQYGKHNTLFSNGFSIERMPVSSAIMTPNDGDIIIHDGKLHLEGWAYSGGENWVERIECSVDGGFTWYPVPEENMSKKHYYTWRLWNYDIPLDAEGWCEILVRAWDSSCNTQPTTVRSVWNWDLHVTQSCHKIKLYSVNRTKPLTAQRLQEYEEAGMDFASEPITRPVPWPLEDIEKYKERYNKYPREPLD